MDSIIIPKEKHKFYGIGDIVYNYDNKERYLIVSASGIKIATYSGSWAEAIWMRLVFNNVKIEQYIQQSDIINAACDVCKTSIDELKSKKRDENIVFARHLILWSLRVKLKWSIKSAAKVVDKHHCTTLHAIKCIETEYKYMKENQRDWKMDFLNNTFNQLK